MPNGSTDGGGVDAVPAQSPVLVTSIAVAGIPGFRASATGGVYFGDGCTIPPNATCDPPDGDISFVGGHAIGPSNGIADVTAPYDSLIGVFLDDTQPDASPAPPALDFSSGGIGINFIELAPELKQPFFIGDGRTGGGVAQVFHVPAGATRLFLGTLDGSGWFNNTGQFDVTLSATGGHTYVVNSMADRALQPGWPESSCVTGFFIPGVGLECTLRAAIEAANVAPDHDRIEIDPTMAVDLQGYVTLTPATALPTIFDAVTIDGTTAPGYDIGDPDQIPIVQIDGAGVGGSGIGLRVQGSAAEGTVIRGLALYRWFIGLDLSSGSTTVQGSHIGIRNGNHALGNGTGIYVFSSENVIGQSFDPDIGWSGRGNVISANAENGIWVTQTFDNLIAGNRIGTDRTGTTTTIPFGGTTPNGANGIEDAGTRTSIGGLGVLTSGTLVASGNLIAGNAFNGIHVHSAARLTMIYANFIGTNQAGTAALPNGGSGVRLEGLLPLVGEAGAGRNLISGNGSNGILGVADTVAIVEGNAIGTDDDEVAPLGNGSYGIRFDAGTAIIHANTIAASRFSGVKLNSGDGIITDNFVGTNDVGSNLGNTVFGLELVGSNYVVGSPGNTIGFNGVAGIELAAGSNNFLSGNYLGTDDAGRNLGNLAEGIVVVGSSHGTFEANVIGFNLRGVYVDASSESNRFVGNYIGTNAQGDDVGNVNEGVFTEGSFTWVGSRRHETAPWQMAANRNVIAFNATGVVVDSAADFVSIRGNSVHSNVGIGIDLGADGTTVNDPGDTDVGENRLQNHPELDATGMLLHPGGSMLDVRYKVDTEITEAGFPLQIDFYVTDFDAQEGMEWIGTDWYPGLSAGEFYESTIAVELASKLQTGNFIVATASDFTTGGTSEFSAAAQVVPEPHPLLALAAGVGWLGCLSRGRGARRSGHVPSSF